MDAVGIASGGCNTLIAIASPTSSAALRSRGCRCPLQARPLHSRLLVAASQDASAEAAPPFSSEAPPPITVTDLLRSSALEAPSSSLISYANIERAFRGQALPTPDHYGILGVGPEASYQEVETAFRKRCEIVLQQGLGEEEIRKRFQALKASYDVLSSEEERRLYDWSLLRLRSPENVYAWPFQADITQRESEPGPPMPPKDEEGIQNVRNFFIGWLVLSVVLNLILK